MLLNEPFDSELTPEEQEKAERRRIAIQIGAYAGQKNALAAMRLKPK